MNYRISLCLFGLLLSLLVLPSCSDPKPGTLKNDQIKAGKREDFHALNEQAFADLKANKPKWLHDLLSKELIESNYTDRAVEHISNSLKVSDYTLLDEYYVVNKWKNADTIMNTNAGIHSYDLYYPGTAREMYMAFFVSKTGDDKSLISLVYCKFDYGWKINAMDVSPYTFNGKTAPELFKLAKEQYDKHYLIDAVNTMASADKCLRPVDMWQYPNENDIRSFYGTIVNEANDKYTFPFTIKQVPTQPRIFRIFNKTIAEGTYPMIYYLTRINLKNTAEVKKENDLVRKAIGQVIPGIDKDKKYILYSAFNKMPSATEEPDSYDVTDKLP